MPSPPLLEDTFLRSNWSDEFNAFENSEDSAALLARLHAWASRDVLTESSTETPFIQKFFVETWGYSSQGEETAGYSYYPQFPVPGAGQSGGTGAADLALGNFGSGQDGVPQVLCEFKDIRSGLDAKQPRKGNNRSPVEQCFDYLQAAWQLRERDCLTEPFFALVTDMNEFRLYTRRHGRSQFQRFVISGSGDVTEPDLLGNTPAADFRRFVFWRIFQPDMLLAERGSPPIDQLLRDQVIREKKIEKEFYHEYRDYRQFVYEALVRSNPDFGGTRGQLVRLTQRFLDRCIFILFCEDMGRELRYPPNLLRNILIERSQSHFYDPEGSGPWDEMRSLFGAMRDGGNCGPHAIDRFNGGLFAEDAELDSLKIPASVFCAKSQASNLLGHPKTLLYFSAAYNFGLSSAAGERAISLYTLGRIFEQSITELEIMEAEADDRVSINKLSKRKTDGVYYTPEGVVSMIVEQTVGVRFEDIKADLGFEALPILDKSAIDQYRAYLADGRRTAKTGGTWIKFLKDYRQRLNQLRIVDPACGSGAFLIQALNRLVEEYRWVIAEKERIEGGLELFDQDSIIRSILAHNIYGVDINPESVEITKLALWLHTATPGKPLCALDNNIQCGNSLVGADFPAFYDQRHESLFAAADANERERINAFDWRAAFPEVFSHGGFDCVIGNPPYIKLQHFRRAQEDVAAYLVGAENTDGTPLYASTQSGNFDMYLPFVEKGVRLLRPEGRMGYIAPNVWMVNEYGIPLRRFVRRTRSLDRWLDFKSHQIFDEAITYTSLQFFRGSANEAVTCAFAPDGNAAAIQWEEADRIPYEELPEEAPWILAPRDEKEMLGKLLANRSPLSEIAEDNAVGFRGIESGADEFFHFDRRGPDSYVGVKKGARMDMRGIEARLDDGIMRKLVSSDDAKRYTRPDTIRYTIFPYDTDETSATILSDAALSSDYPLCNEWFQSHAADLKKRDNGAMNVSTGWYGYTRPMNLHLQGRPKIGVPQTVQNLNAFFDSRGEFCFNNVRVGGILVSDEITGWFLLAVLNSPVPNWVFKRIARPKEGGYFEANKQFIAPLPIPDATPEIRVEVGAVARELQELHTLRRDTVAKLEKRLHSTQTAPRSPALKEEWLWSVVGTPTSWKQAKEAAHLNGRELTSWAKQRHKETLQERIDSLDVLLQPGVTLDVTNSEDELVLHIGGREALRLFDRPDTLFLAAQWRHALRDINVTESFDGKKLVKKLLALRTTSEQTLRDRILSLDEEIESIGVTIAAKELELNQIIYRLYGLSPAEIEMIEAG